MNASVALGDEDPLGQPRVLLVDDDEVNLLLTSIALRERGFSITEATSGERAIQVLADWLPDVVVLDAMMPGMDGFQTCRELRSLPGFESLPVLMLTGLDDDASINRAYEAGATDFFVKSTHWSLLAGRLRYLCARPGHGSNSNAASPSWHVRKTWPAWAASTGSAIRAARCSRSKACGCSASGRAPTSNSGSCCACCRRKTARDC